MPEAKVRILIVDDKASIRTSISLLLIEMGYDARSAKDGFSALCEIRRETPAILLSDLNMPGMSGFELLLVVRQRFPEIQVIAMSGAFSGEEVPPGISADAFYQKGSSAFALLQILKALQRSTRRPPAAPRAMSPLWIERDINDSAVGGCVRITCPECLRRFSQATTGVGQLASEVDCVHCGNPIKYAVAESSGEMPTPALRSGINTAIAVQAAATQSN